ncbi:MAG: TetR/AcrR family transcriptional regulator [Labilithrix sp.]|nr:TetR/AcrR family transcriptional regulator [Labilithrix sp.]
MTKKRRSTKTDRAEPARKLRDPQRTRENILAAAERMFIDRGFAGSSLRDIAGAAGVAQGLLSHHFPSKRELWRAVVERHTAPYLELQQRDLAQADGDALRAAVSSYFRYWQSRTDVLRMWTWADLERDDPFDAQAGTAGGGAERGVMYANAVPALRALQRSGDLRADIEPMHVVAMIAASVTFWLQRRGEICAALGRAPSDPGVDDDFLASLLVVLFEGIGAPRAPRKGKKR